MYAWKGIHSGNVQGKNRFIRFLGMSKIMNWLKRILMAMLYVIEKVKDFSRYFEINLFKVQVGGVCPWCGSSNVTIRSGFERRNCPICQVTFNEKCPVCHEKAMSLGFNEKHLQYGCDRCGTVFDKEQNIVTDNDIERRTMWFQAYNLRAGWFMSWLTMVLIIIGVLSIILIVIFKRG